jgi:hypothetical protein
MWAQVTGSFSNNGIKQRDIIMVNRKTSLLCYAKTSCRMLLVAKNRPLLRCKKTGHNHVAKNRPPLCCKKQATMLQKTGHCYCMLQKNRPLLCCNIQATIILNKTGHYYVAKIDHYYVARTGHCYVAKNRPQ